MSDQELTLAAKLSLEARGWIDGLGHASKAEKEFSERALLHFERVNDQFERVKRTLEGFGIGLGGYEFLRENALLSKSFTQLAFNVGASKDEIAEYREGLEAQARTTGTALQNLTALSAYLGNDGTDLKALLPVVTAIDKATLVAGGDSQQLAMTLQDVAGQFHFDLDNPKQAKQLIDEMVVAGQQGNIKLDGFTKIFETIGPSAAAANLSFEKTLALTESLSQVISSSRRLAPLEASILDLFATKNYKQSGEIEALTGVRFNQGGQRRDPIAVLQDIQKQYQRQRNPNHQQAYLARIFGGDSEAIRGLETLFSGNNLDKIAGIVGKLKESDGAVDKGIRDQMDEAATQSARLKENFKQAADYFTIPINRTLADLLKFNNDIGKKTAQPGLATAGLTVAEIAGAGALAYGAKWLGRKGGGLLGRLLGGAAGTAEGVVEGKALEAAAGVTPVFVVNFPDTFGPVGAAKAVAETVTKGAGLGGAAEALGAGAGASISRLATLATIGTLGAYGAAGAAGYGVGSLIYKAIDTTDFADKLGGTIAQALARLGVKDADEAIDRRNNAEIKIKIDSPNANATVTGMRSQGLDVDVSTGVLAMSGYY